MKALIIKWEKRLIAGLLAMTMLSGMIPTALAAEEGTEGNGTGQSTLLMKDAEQAGKSDADDAELILNSEENAAESIPETVSESIPETKPETVPTEGQEEESEITEASEELLLEESEESPLLFSSGVRNPLSVMALRAVEPDPTLTLEQAIAMSELFADGDDQKILLSELESVITVRNGAGLILLSNVVPADYADKTVLLVLTESSGISEFDLTSAVSIPCVDDDCKAIPDENGNNTTADYQFLGLGHKDRSFRGTLLYDKYTPENISANRPLFNNLSTDAVLPNLYFVPNEGNTTAILAEKVTAPAGTEGDEDTDWQVTLSKNGKANGSNASFPCLIYNMNSGSKAVKLTLTNTVELGEGISSLKCTSTGLFCAELTSGTLTVKQGQSNALVVVNSSTIAGGLVGRMSDGTLQVDAETILLPAVTASAGSAGGYVGEMNGGTVNFGTTTTAEDGSTNTVSGGTVPAVTATNGAAGGVVGTLSDGTVNVIDGTISGVKAATSGAAGGVVGTLSGSGTVTMSGGTVSSVEADSGNVGGVVGTLENGTVTVSGGKITKAQATSGNAGGVAGTMSGGTVAVSGGTIDTVTSAKGDVGGYVGCMTAGEITLAGGTVSKVTTSSGNAGGILGKVEKAADAEAEPIVSITGNYSAAQTITSSASGSAGGFAGSSTDILPAFSEEAKLTISSTITATGGNAGGLVGQYTNTIANTLNLSRYSINVTVNAGTSGGIFGTATNKAVLTIDGAVTTGETVGRTEIQCKRSGGSPFGGVVGIYKSNSGTTNEEKLKAKLAVSNLILTLTNLGGTSGGVIGTLPETCYVEMGGLEIAKTGTPGIFGGLIAQMGKEKGAQPSFLYVNDDVTIALGSELSGANKGGLIGDLFQGVVCLSGNTKVSGTVKLGGDIGRVIGRNDDGFVYAESGWKFTPPDGNASNIGNGTEVLRLNEKTRNPITVNEKSHKVTVNAIQVVDGYYQLNSAEDFLAYAISFNYARSHYGGTYANEGVLEFGTDINTTDDQYVKVNAPIDLSGTSFLGIGRDNGIRVTPDVKVLNPFKGVFDGGGNTITLGMGTGDNPLNMNNINGHNNHHGRLALFSYVKEATIKNLIVDGEIKARVVGGSGSNYLLSIAGVTAYQESWVNYENVTSKVKITIESGGIGDMAIGGIVAQCANDSTVSLKKCTLSCKIDASGKTPHCGLLGGSWLKTNVTFGDSSVGGVTVKDATLSAGTNFGGLVSRATGYWNATAADSIRFSGTNSISGTSESDNTRGLLVGDGLGPDTNAALYLEVGTWGSAPGTSYGIDGTVDLSDETIYFDELVGKTTRGESANNNGLVSLQLPDGAQFDQGGQCTTYTTQLGDVGKSLKNKNTRYYYNLNVFRDKVYANNASSVEKLVLWGARQFAASNIRNSICTNVGNSFSGNLDLTGYSYYPVSPMGAVTIGNATVNGTTLKFAYNKLNDIEKDNKQPSNDQKQHYLMHCGLIYNTTNNVTVQNTTIAGTVGTVVTVGTDGTVGTGSGALICGSISGDDTAANKKKTVNLTNITLAGLKVAGGNTPLLINSIPTAVRLEVNGLSTGASRDDKYNSGDIAASSLIGAVGQEGAKYLELEFSNIALDGRIGQKDTTIIRNNGETDVDYKTYGSIFSKATLLDSFQYASDSYGIYNFYSGDEKVTFGKEISNSEESGCRNPGEQYWYYDDGAVENDLFVWDGIGQKPVPGQESNDHFKTGYLPYVRQNETDGYLEMDINKKPVGLTVGCGTYADPYRINNGRQLTYLAYYLSNPEATVVKNYQVCFNTTILTDLKNGATDFTAAEVAHDKDSGGSSDVTYTWNGKNWGSGGPSKDNALLYLRNAYYLITGDITLNKQDYRGIGTLAQPFSGVIIGQKSDDENSRYPTVSIKVKNSSVANFGGLIRYSNGSVVKNLALDYDGTRIGMVNAAVPGNGNNPFFGGVVGYCMGGDTIIDNVSVTNADASVSYSGDKSHLIAAGGYVGLVGGAREASGTETTGGGVVFRGTIGKSTFGVESKDYFYKNPYVGRVLDGYACYEAGQPDPSGHTLDNTDKNYTIPDVSPSAGGLVVNGTNVTVSSAQGLWLLSAIVNSGAANGEIDAYKTGKPRSASYDSVGTIPSENPTAAAADEAHWGGISNTDCVSYLVKIYAPGAQNLCAGPAYSLSFTKDVNVSDYKNGFRGIGASYGYSANIRTDANRNNWENNVWRRNLRVSGVNGGTHTVTLEMNQKLYRDEAQNDQDNQTYSGNDWFHQGAGLFVDFMSTDLCTVSDLTITGTVQLSYYDGEGNPTGSYGTYRAPDKKTTADNSTCPDPCVGGFAARTIYSGAGSTSTIQFTNLSLEGLTVGGGKYTGGAIGCVEKLGHNRSVTFDGSLNLTGLKVSSKGDNVCYTGGLIGWYNGGGSLTLGADGTQVTVDASGSGVSSQMELPGATCARMGLLAGNVSSGTVTVQKLTFNGVNVEGLRVANVGGLFGCCESGVTSVTINDCALADLTAVSKNGQTDDVENDHGIFGLGGIIGRDQAKATKLTNVTISGSSKIYAGFDGDTQPFSVGGMVGILDKKDSNNKNEATFENCKVTGTGGNPILILNSSVRAISNLWEDVKKCNAGGLIGFDSQNTELKKCTLAYVNVMSCITVGGLIGHENTNGLKISDVVLQGCNVVIPKTSAAYRAGLITGFTWDEINGYRILAKDTSVGYFFDWECNASTPTETILTGMKTMNTSNVGLNLQNGSNQSNFYTYSSALSGEAAGYTKSKYIGTWLGDQGKAINIKLVAVAVKNCNTPLGNYGTEMLKANRPGVKVVYADYPADQDDLVEEGSLKLDVLPKTNSTVMKGDTPITLTGNGAGFYEDSGKNKGYLSAIWEESGNPNRFNMTYRSHGLNLTTEQNAYGSTFNAEEVVRNQEGQAVTIPDFSVLVIPMNDHNNNAKDYVDTALWNCIAALTNAGSDGSAATIESVKSMVTSVDVGMYQWQEGVDGTGTFVKQDALAGLNCSGKTFSLSGEVDNNKNRFTLVDVLFENPLDTNNPYHLYLPVLVRKVLQVSAEVNMLTGSSYYPDDYSEKGGYITAGFSEPVTAFIKYRYNDRTLDEWKQALTAEKGCNWYYEKVLDLCSSPVSRLPSGTRLTLVDAQTRKMYWYELKEGDNQKEFNLKLMKDSDGNVFVPQLVSSFLMLDEGGNVTGTKDECYYLTIQLPEPSAGDESVVNMQLSCPIGTLPKSEGAPVGRLSSSVNHRYVIYKRIVQAISSETRKVNAANENDTEMDDEGSISVTLSAKLSFADPVVKREFGTYPPAALYHQFNVSMRKYLADVQEDYPVALDAKNILWQYTLSGPGNTSCYDSSGQCSPNGQSVLSVGYGGKELVTWMQQYGELTATAVITLEYGNDVGSIFPSRSSDEDGETGLYVSADSRLANEANQLSITTNKVTGKDPKRYYTMKPSTADMVFEAAGNANGSDHSKQLGINPLDPGPDTTTNPITAAGSYEFNPSAEMEWLKQGVQIRYTFKLSKKTDAGYVGVPAEKADQANTICDYLSLQNIQIDGVDVGEENIQKRQYDISVYAPFDVQSLKSSVVITVNPATGSGTSKLTDFDYANYKLEVTAVLMDGDKEIYSTQAFDYIVYTNAKIRSDLIKLTN